MKWRHKWYKPRKFVLRLLILFLSTMFRLFLNTFCSYCLCRLHFESWSRHLGFHKNLILEESGEKVCGVYRRKKAIFDSITSPRHLTISSLQASNNLNVESKHFTHCIFKLTFIQYLSGLLFELIATVINDIFSLGSFIEIRLFQNRLMILIIHRSHLLIILRLVWHISAREMESSRRFQIPTELPVFTFVQIPLGSVSSPPLPAMG